MTYPLQLKRLNRTERYIVAVRTVIDPKWNDLDGRPLKRWEVTIQNAKTGQRRATIYCMGPEYAKELARILRQANIHLHK